MATIHLLITGKVQGVFFRATAKEVADRLKLHGWIRNSPDGNVEAVVSGADEKLNEFAAWCKKGSRGSEVHEVIVTKQHEQDFDGFEVRH